MKSLSEILKSIVDIFPWHVISVLLAILFGTTTIYLALREIKPNISLNIINEANVLDVHKPLKDLTILFQGNNIQKNNLNLRIITIRIENNGNKNILQGDYDNKVLWGLKIEYGKIIETRLVDNNSDYVMSNLNPTLIGDDFLQFSKIIFEKGKYFILEILVLHKKDNLPNLIHIGKIAGIDNIVPVKVWKEKGERTFLGELFHGSTIIQITRFVVSVLASIIIIILVALIGEKATDYRTNRRKKLREREIESNPIFQKLKELSKNKVIFDIYINEGDEGLKRLQMLLEDNKKLRLEIKKHEMRKLLLEEYAEDEEVPSMRSIAPMSTFFPFFIARSMTVGKLLEDGLLTKTEDDKLLVDEEFHESLREFIKFLESKKK